MLCTKLIRLASWMQRIAQKDQGHRIADAGSSELRRNPSAHRLAADRELTPVEFLVIANSVHHCQVTGLQSVVAVWDATAVFHVEKIEGDYINSARGEGRSEAHHEVARLICASSVPEDQSDSSSIPRGRGIGDRSHALVLSYLDADSFRHPSRPHFCSAVGIRQSQASSLSETVQGSSTSRLFPPPRSSSA